MKRDAGVNVEKEEHYSIAGGITSYKNHSENQSGCSSEKLDIVLPEDPVIPFLSIYLADASTCNKETCATMFTEAIL